MKKLGYNKCILQRKNIFHKKSSMSACIAAISMPKTKTTKAQSVLWPLYVYQRIVNKSRKNCIQLWLVYLHTPNMETFHDIP